MKTRFHILVFLMTVSSVITFGQSSLEIPDEHYLSICTVISELKEVEEAGLIEDFDGTPTLFIHDKLGQLDQPTTIKADGYQINIWHLQDLFVHDILHWIEILEVLAIENGFVIEIQSKNTDESRSDKPLIGGTLTCRIVEEELHLKSENVEFLE